MDTWSGNQYPTYHLVWPKIKGKKERKKKKNILWFFPGGPVVKNPPSNAGDAGSIPGRGANIPTHYGVTKSTCHT